MFNCRKLSLLFIFCLSVAFFTATLVNAAQTESYIVSGRGLDQVANTLPQMGGKVNHHLRYQSAMVVDSTPGAIGKLRKHYPDLEIEIDHPVQLIEPHAKGRPGGGSAQPPQSIPWGISATQATQAWNYTRGAGAIVCVVDTGAQGDHPDLAGNITGGENFVASKGIVDPSKWADDNNHGTHVAGTIAAVDNSIGVIGVAPNAKIFAVKVLNRQGSGTSSAVADGILSCVANGAHIINLSLGSSTDSTAIRNAVVAAQTAGLVVIAAAGNESGPVSYPAKYPGVIAVSAVDANLDFASFSNFGPEVAFAAPGVGVLSTTKGSTYSSYSGTSMASPHVAGVAALLLSSGAAHLQGDDIGLSTNQQGVGFINALATVLSQ